MTVDQKMKIEPVISKKQIDFMLDVAIFLDFGQSLSRARVKSRF